MVDPHTVSLFQDTVVDPRFPIALGIAALAGMVRGFSGFGSALVYMPLISAVYGPTVAAPTLLLIDSICSLPIALHAMPQCNWREVAPVSIAGAVVLPFGALALVVVDPLSLRWFIAVLVLAALATLVAGWRYHGRPTLAASLGVGALAGFGGGAVQIGAPPLLVFWLGGNNNAVTVRANIMVYFIMQGALSMVMYFFSGLFNAQAIVLSLLLGLPFALAMAGGAYWFHGSSDALYRRAAYLIIALAALVSLPVFDGLR
ncbi:MAG: TSUP family transporter [Hyphomicrobiales bacterium]